MNRAIRTSSINGSTFQSQQISETLVEIDGRKMVFDFKQIEHNLFSLILDGKWYLVHCLTDELRQSSTAMDGDPSKLVNVSIKGGEYSVQFDDERSLRLKQFFTMSHAGSSSYVIRAPMPGLISRIEVEVGSTVTKGQGLLVLEAMKMENEIRAMGGGRVKEIHVKKTRAVEKDEPLITIEEL